MLQIARAAAGCSESSVREATTWRQGAERVPFRQAGGRRRLTERYTRMGFRVSSGSLLGPYSSRRLAASSPLRPLWVACGQGLDWMVWEGGWVGPGAQAGRSLAGGGSAACSQAPSPAPQRSLQAGWVSLAGVLGDL
jgi:hypothetical protein